MTPLQFAARQRGIHGRLATAVRRLLFLRGAPATDAERVALAGELFRLVQRERVESHRFATAMIVREAARFGVVLTPPQIRPYDSGALVRVLERATGVGRDVPKVSVRILDPETKRVADRPVSVTESNRTDATVVSMVSKRVERTAVRHAQQAGREAVHDAADSAGNQIGWARVLSGAENCAWCAMLASRGPVYHSRQAAGGDDPYHDNCDCFPVLVKRGESWIGQGEQQRLEALWAESTGRVYGKAKVKAFAKAWREVEAERRQAARVAA